MIAGVRDRRHVQHPRGVVLEVAVQLPGHHWFQRAENLLQLRRPHDVGAGRNAPHQIGEFVVRAEHHGEIARKCLRSLRCAEAAGRGAFQHHCLVSIGLRRGRSEYGPAAHRMAFESDVVDVHRVERAQIRERVRAAEAVGKRRRLRKAVAALVEREHDVTAARELDREPTLRLPRIDVAVHRENARRLVRAVDTVGRVEQGAQTFSVRAGELHAFHAYAAADCLDLVRGETAENDEHQSDADQHVMHADPRVTLGIGRCRCTAFAHGFRDSLLPLGKSEAATAKVGESGPRRWRYRPRMRRYRRRCPDRWDTDRRDRRGHRRRGR